MFQGARALGRRREEERHASVVAIAVPRTCARGGCRVDRVAGARHQCASGHDGRSAPTRSRRRRARRPPRPTTRPRSSPTRFSNGSTIVAAYQVGRIYDGGACAIGFATSTNNGATWTSGLLPGITKWAGGGPNDRATDASVAYDARHNVWLISSLTLLEAGGVHGNAVVTSRSTDGGLTWSNPVHDGDRRRSSTRTGSSATTPRPVRSTATATRSGTTTAAGNRLQMSTSTDGGLTWSAPATNNTGVIGGQPVVRPDGTVIVPIANANETADRRVQLHQRRRELERGHHDRDDPPPHGRGQPARGAAALRGDRRRRHGLRRLGGLPLPPRLQDQRHRAQPLAQRDRHELVSGRARPDRRDQQQHRSLHPRPGREQGHVGRDRAARPDLLLLSPRAARSSASASSPPPTPAARGARRRRWPAACPRPGRRRPARAEWSAITSRPPTARTTSRTASSPPPRHRPAATSCSSVLDNCREPTSTFVVRPRGRWQRLWRRSPVLFSGNGGADANSLWNVVDNNGSKHRD